MEQIQAIKFDVEEVGKHVKGSKKRYTWQVSLKDKYHTIILDFSFISGKVKITVDRKILLENELPANVSFQYPFTLDGFALNIIQQGENFQLRINNKVFSHLYTQQKTNTQFKKYQQEVKDIKVNITQMDPHKKISLNIGALGGVAKKKRQNNGQSDSWGAFTGGSFPSYFGDTPQVQDQKPQVATKKVDLLNQQQKIERVQPQSNLLEATSSEKKTQSFFEMTSSPQTSKNQSQQFGNMQDMFSQLNMVSQPPKSNQIDFFAEEPKKQVVATSPPTSVVTTSPPAFSFDVNFSGPSSSSFSTGFSPASISSKQFATTVPNKAAQIDFFNAPKQQINLSGFGKKPVAQPVTSQQLESILSGQNVNAKAGEVKVSNPLTDISINDYMQHKPPTKAESNLDFNLGGGSLFNSQTQPSTNDFNTMQNLFQSTSGGQLNFGGFNQSNITSSQPPATNNFTLPPVNTTTATFENEFNTMSNLFKTTNYENLNMNRPPPQVNEVKPLPDFLKNNNPNVFASLGGVNSGTAGFNMANFGTMQINNPPKSGGIDFNFLQTKPNPSSNPGAGNLI